MLLGLLLLTLSGPGLASSNPAARSLPAPHPENQAGDSLDVVVGLLRETFLGIREMYIDPVPMRTLLDAALAGVQQHLDAQSRFLSQEELDEIRSTAGRTAGIGVTLDLSGEYPRLRKVHPGSPAAAADLRPGDSLLRVDGRLQTGLDAGETRDLLRGPPGSLLELELASPGEASRNLSVTRGRFHSPPLESKLILDGRVGYIRIERFGNHVADSLETVLRAWSQASLKGLILDLRGNPGGLLDEAISAADLLLPRGKEIVRTVGRHYDESSIHVSLKEGLLSDLPRVVLVDSLTASSAEVFAGALKSTSETLLLGTATFGKRSVQRIIPLSAGGALKVTSSSFFTPADLSTGHLAGSPIPADEASRPAKETSSQVTAVLSAGSRLLPDRNLTVPALPEPWSWIENQGLLERFVATETMREDDLQDLTFWNHLELRLGPGRARGWLGIAPDAPGFERWRKRLLSRLRDWGVVVDADGLSCESMRHTWIADWVTERIGESGGRVAAIELDPWVQEALGELARLPLCARQQAAELVRTGSER
ncbi:S41 family peptidase [Candidatus Eisenbacteria bacterium]|uniref:S41 family peptidase n=1 Tax=Eiseniibacteriota bacterium TaxID=2212470 RepID=A0ABV6YKR0_UNCEI